MTRLILRRRPRGEPHLRLERIISQSRDSSSDYVNENRVEFTNEILFLTNHLSQHKTTLGEAEIQNAVEAAAGLFKKVVIQRRNAKKAAEEGEQRDFWVLKILEVVLKSRWIDSGDKVISFVGLGY